MGALAQQLAARGHELVVVTSNAVREAEFWAGNSAPEQREQVDGVDIRRCGLRPYPAGFNGLRAWRRAMITVTLLPGDQSAVLEQMARGFPPIVGLDEALSGLDGPFDIVHGFNISWERPSVAGYHFARRMGISFVATPFAHLGSGVSDRVTRNSTMDHQLRLLASANAVMVLTEAERNALTRIGVSPERVRVIGGGVDPVPQDFRAAELWRDPALRPPEPYVIFVGRGSYDKGAMHLVEAIARLRRSGCPVSLAFVGQASPELATAIAAQTADMQQAIHQYGVVLNQDKHALLDHAALLALPSHVDSFGITLLEAWSHGKPVVAAAAGGVVSVVDDDQNGLLVAFGDVPALADAIRTLLDDPALASELGAAGRAKVQAEYTWEAVADRVLAGYRQL